MLNVQTLAIANTDTNVRKSIDHALGHRYKVTVMPNPPARGELTFVDLIIYDLSSGLDVLKALRKSKPDVPVLVLAPEKSTGNLVAKALALGAIDFVTKPLDEHELHLRVSRSLHQWRLLSIVRSASRTGSRDMLQENQAQGGAKLLNVPLKELHSSSGRLDASKIAKYLDTTLAAVAKAAGASYTSVHKTPDSVSIQPQLSTIKRVLGILLDMLGKREVVLAWLNSAHPDLGGRTPLSVILQGHSDAVLTMLENALAGVAS